MGNEKWNIVTIIPKNDKEMKKIADRTGQIGNSKIYYLDQSSVFENITPKHIITIQDENNPDDKDESVASYIFDCIQGIKDNSDQNKDVPKPIDELPAGNNDVDTSCLKQILEKDNYKIIIAIHYGNTSITTMFSKVRELKNKVWEKLKNEEANIKKDDFKIRFYSSQDGDIYNKVFGKIGAGKDNEDEDRFREFLEFIINRSEEDFKPEEMYTVLNNLAGAMLYLQSDPEEEYSNRLDNLKEEIVKEYKKNNQKQEIESLLDAMQLKSDNIQDIKKSYNQIYEQIMNDYFTFK